MIRPIIFSGPMVRALLSGRKTQTRRVIKNIETLPNGMITPKAGYVPRRPEDHVNYCPYGQPGDLVWVRERWRIGAWNEDNGTVAVDYCDGPLREWLSIPNDYDGEKFNRLWISCSDELSRKNIKPDAAGRYSWQPGHSPLRWRPSIHMPRWASRLTLRITNVRVERVQEISEKDAKAEGADPTGFNATMGGEHIAGFWLLWDSINARRGYVWSDNPWVWVISFEAIQANVNTIAEAEPCSTA